MPDARPVWKRPPDQIVDRLWPLIVEGGWPAKIDDLCEPADIPRATLYYYVPGMPAFVAWVVDEQLRRSADAVRDAALGAASPHHALELAARTLAKQWSQTPHIAARLLDRSGAGQGWADLHDLVERLVRAAQPRPSRHSRKRATALLGALAALAVDRASPAAAVAAVRSLV